MTEIKKFFLKDVRCFAGRQEFNIRPLTFLVGENSTGKSTVLGCMQALGGFVADLSSQIRFSFDVNKGPYDMGVFADIVRDAGEGARKTRSFDLGFEIEEDSVVSQLHTTLIEQSSGSEPSIARIEVEFDEGSVVCEVVKRKKSERFLSSIHTMEKKSGVNAKPVFKMKILNTDDLLEIFWAVNHPQELDFYRMSLEREGGRSNKKHLETLKDFEKFAETVNSRSSRDMPRGRKADISRFLPPYIVWLTSFAPVRAKPLRVYTPKRDTEDPEGSSVPMTLINLFRKDKNHWAKIRKSLKSFGESSGLFTDINMKPLGESGNDPFQIQLQIESGGPKVNIADVGYGISQILPFLVRVLSSRQKTTFLVQQPEVHLHPKGQAALCSLFTNIAKKHNRSFVIETHSDYMIKRARIEIMKGNISPDDVSLIYLEPVKNKVKVHNITFDENANFSPPKSYGEFFLQESNKVLGFED